MNPEPSENTPTPAGPTREPGPSAAHPPDGPGLPIQGYGHQQPAYGYAMPQPGHPVPQQGYAVPPGVRPGYPYPPVAVPHSPAGQPLASFGDRLLAYMIDTAISTAIAFVVLCPAIVVAVMLAAANTEVDPDGVVTTNPAAPLLLIIGVELVLLVVLLVGEYFYLVEYQLRRGQTLGKKVMKIKITPLAPGVALTRVMLLKRYLVQYVAGVFVPFFSYVDGFWQLWDKPFQQCLHDKAAETVVVKVIS